MNTPTVGLDISLRSFVAALWFGTKQCLLREFSNNPAGFRALLKWMASHCAGAQVRIGVEATNTYAEAVLEFLYRAGHVVYLLNPERTACYARCCGARNKTDQADAPVIAMYVAKHDCTPWHPPSPEQKELRGVTRARHQLSELATQLSNQIRTAEGAGRAALQAALQEVRAQIATLIRQVKQLLRQHAPLRQAIELLMTIKGVGFVTAATLVAELPPITDQTDPRTIAAWAGLTPRRYQSGDTEWRTRLSRKGNAQVRNALYMPALVAKRWNPLFADYAHRLAERGKSSGAILGAISHKMLRIAVGLLRTKSAFDPAWRPKKT